jgi:hypothetical protein
MSNAAANVLAMLRKPRYISQPFDNRRKVKHVIPRIAAMMASRAEEYEAIDFSRLAWLALVTDNEKGASAWVERGLKLDPDNVHCLSLAQRLDIRIERPEPRSASLRHR